MRAYALEVADPVDDVDPPPAGPIGKRTLTARLQARGTPARERVALTATGAGEPLPPALARVAAATFGHDLSAVRVHLDGQAEALGVAAFTVGDHVHVAAGAYQPATAAGRDLLGHELAHVVQQRAGQVAGDGRDRDRDGDGARAAAGTAVVHRDAALEAEADRAGARLARADFDVEAFLAGPTRGDPPAASPPAGAPTGGAAAGTALQGKDLPAARNGGGGAGPASAAAGATPGIPADDVAALARWRQGYDRFDRVYRWGLALQPRPDEAEPSRHTLFRNTCEWIATGNVKVCLVAPVAAPRQDPRNGTCFDVKLHYPAAGPDPANASPDWDPANFYGFYEAATDVLSLVDLAADRWDDHAIIGTMIHEVQHDADSGPGDATYPDADASFTDYKSEFRAWWIDPIDGPAMGDPRQPAPVGSTVTATDPARPRTAPRSQPVVGFANQRQHGIFMNLAQTPDPANPSVYDYVAQGFVFDAGFRAMVTAYATPVGGNLLNSVRVEHLCELVTGHGLFAAVLACATTELDAADRAFLADKAAAADFWSMAAAHLSARYLGQLEAAIRGGAAPAPDDDRYRYTVVAGDTLSLIAGRLLGDVMRYPEIHAIPENRALIGDDADEIEPGMELIIPEA